MKISCKVIEDLLPLYIDGVCSEESKKIVEDHISTCSICSEKLKQMKSDNISDEDVKSNLNEAKAIKNLSKTWRKKLFLSKVKGIISTLIVIAIILLFIYIFVGVKIG